MKSYIYLSAESIDTLFEDINKYIDNGFKVKGNIFQDFDNQIYYLILTKKIKKTQSALKEYYKLSNQQDFTNTSFNIETEIIEETKLEMESDPLISPIEIKVRENISQNPILDSFLDAPIPMRLHLLKKHLGQINKKLENNTLNDTYLKLLNARKELVTLKINLSK